MKKAIRYLRFSHEGQSNSSIEKQDLSTAYWLERNNVQLIETFTDAGYSGKSFERPDFQKLQHFLQKHHQDVDYLVVDQLDRFSRDAGEAIVLIKALQKKYHIQIVSASEGITFDYNVPGSLFRTGLQMLLAEEENINRANKINGGIYTAKAKEGRYIHNLPPYGYRKEGHGKQRGLVIDEHKSRIVRFIFNSYLEQVSVSEITRQAAAMGFVIKGHGAVKKILKNPVYAGMQLVKSYKDFPGGLFPAKHIAIVDSATWYKVQDKIKEPKRREAKLSEDLPLRGVLKCHCGIPLTGGASRGRLGNYYHYYKCQHKGHNNISAIKINKQIEDILESFTLSTKTVKSILKNSAQTIKVEIIERQKLIRFKEEELKKEYRLSEVVEEKWESNTISFETYQRWLVKTMENKKKIRSDIKFLGTTEEQALKKLYDNVDMLANLKKIYLKSAITGKQLLIKTIFGCDLYYKDGTFYTGYLHDFLKLAYNEHKGNGFVYAPLEA